MQMRTIEIVVGAFMLAGLIALAILAIQVSGFSPGTEEGSYRIHAKFENIGGLVPRAKVTIAGVTVGEVAEITLDEKTFMADVAMDIDADIDEISTDSTAAILTEGLLGGKYIGLSIGAEERVLEDGDEVYDTQSAIVLEELVGQFLMKQF